MPQAHHIRNLKLRRDDIIICFCFDGDPVDVVPRYSFESEKAMISSCERDKDLVIHVHELSGTFFFHDANDLKVFTAD